MGEHKWKAWQRANGTWTCRTEDDKADSLVINHSFASEEDAEWAAEQENAHARLLTRCQALQRDLEAAREALRAMEPDSLDAIGNHIGHIPNCANAAKTLKKLAASARAIIEEREKT